MAIYPYTDDRRQAMVVAVVWPIVFVWYRRFAVHDNVHRAPLPKRHQKHGDREIARKSSQPLALEAALHGSLAPPVRCIRAWAWHCRTHGRGKVHTVYGAGGSVRNQKLCQK